MSLKIMDAKHERDGCHNNAEQRLSCYIEKHASVWLLLATISLKCKDTIRSYGRATRVGTKASGYTKVEVHLTLALQTAVVMTDSPASSR
jgi:hypothetical protein